MAYSRIYKAGQLEESGRKTEWFINKRGESSKNWMLSSLEEKTATKEGQWSVKQDTVASWKPRAERVSRRKK